MQTIDMVPGLTPKRGDLVQTNIGDRRERTWMILRAVHMRRAPHPRRYKVWMARWWDLEPEMRLRLWRSAERNGGQHVIWFKRYPAKRRHLTFEEYMAR